MIPDWVTPDLLNAGFEFVGGILLWINVRVLYKAKEFKGVAIGPTAFFAAWGFWNVYYYPHLDQWVSFYAGLNIVTANTVWVVQMFYYARENRRLDRLKAIHSIVKSDMARTQRAIESGLPRHIYRNGRDMCCGGIPVNYCD